MCTSGITLQKFTVTVCGPRQSPQDTCNYWLHSRVCIKSWYQYKGMCGHNVWDIHAFSPPTWPGNGATYMCDIVVGQYVDILIHCVYNVNLSTQYPYWYVLLGRAWASPTLAWLHCTRSCVCLLACLDRPLTVNHFRLLLCVVTSYVKFKDHSMVEDMSHGQSSSSMVMTKTETAHGTIQWLER